MMGITSAVPQALGDALNIPVEWYSEGDAKKALLNKRSAAKQEIIDAIGELYQVDWTGVKYRDEAIADALAIHYVAQLNSQAIKMMKLKS
jgi:Holliday junction resolvasome RuvABC endonuclease subunit